MIRSLPIVFAGLLLALGSLRSRAQYARYPKLSGDVQPLYNEAIPPWMTLDVSARTRTEFQSSINFKRGDAPLYQLTRLRAGVRLHPAPWFNAYVQVHDAHALTLASTDTSLNMKDTFDLRQALMSFKARNAEFIIGRQPLRFADERLVGISDWTNVSRTFDAFVLSTEGRNRISAFTSSVVNIYPGRADRADGGLHFHGVIAALDAVLPRTSLQPFLFVKTNAGITSPLHSHGTEDVFTAGLFAAGDLPAGFFYSGTVALQRGRYAGQIVRAEGEIVRFGYTARRLPLAPEASVEYDYASGDDGQQVNRRSTFDQLYPSNHAVFGLTDLFGWQNIRQSKGGITIVPHKGISISAALESLRLANVRDALYTGAGAALLPAPGHGFRADGIGTEVDLSAKYLVHDFVTNAGVGHLFPGSVMIQGGKGAPLTVAFLSFTYRFSVQHGPSVLKKAPSNAHHLPQGESDD